MTFSVRTTKPTSKYYNTSANGGVSQCITGSPLDKDANVLSNCVGYACGRFNEIIGKMKYPKFYCNAENFITQAKTNYPELEIGQTAKVGAIMVWSKGKVGVSSDGAGHVAIVEKVIDSKTVYTSESAYSGAAFFNSTRSNSNGRWGLGTSYEFLGFIYNPSVVESTSTPTTDSSSSYYTAFENTSIVDGLKSIKVDSTFANRNKIATANGIKGYMGSSSQNIALLNLAKKGVLKKC